MLASFKRRRTAYVFFLVPPGTCPPTFPTLLVAGCKKYVAYAIILALPQAQGGSNQ